MVARKSFYTGTAPDGNEILFMVEKKNGVVANLPVV
jgi:hypothetical protein